MAARFRVHRRVSAFDQRRGHERAPRVFSFLAPNSHVAGTLGKAFVAVMNDCHGIRPPRVCGHEAASSHFCVQAKQRQSESRIGQGRQLGLQAVQAGANGLWCNYQMLAVALFE